MNLMRSPLRMTAAALVPLIVAAAGAGEAGAQLTGAITAGSGSARLGTGSATEIVSVAPRLQWQSRLFRFDAYADYAEHSGRGWQTTGLVSVAFQFPLTGALKAEIIGTGAWSRLSWGQAAAGALGEARLELSGPTRGFSMSAGAGRAFPYGPSEGLSRIEARTWSQVAGMALGFSLRRTGIVVPGSISDTRSDPPPFEDTLTAAPVGNSARRIVDHYTDLNATLGWARRNLELEAGFGRRFGKPVAQYTSWRIQGLYWLSERFAVVGSAGRFPADVVSGLPSGNYAMLSMRVSWQDRSLPSRTSVPARLSRRAGGFEAGRSSKGVVALNVWAPAADQVEVMGSFSDWKPVELETATEGWWRTELALAPGLYEINVRINGGAWQVPPGLTTVDDEFGGKVGVFTIED